MKYMYKICVRKVKGKKRVQSLVQLLILSQFVPYNLLLAAHLLGNENELICLR